MYIVTGGAGFIGSAMVWKLNSLGIDDILIVDNLRSSEKWKNLVNRKFEQYMHRDDFLDAVYDDAIDADIEGIIHMGACSDTTELDADFLMQNNLEYSKQLCEYANQKDARFINASSAATYGNGTLGFNDSEDHIESLKPLNMYGYSKHLFDLWAMRHGYLDSIVSLKFFNVYGPNEQHKGNMRSVVNKAYHQILDTGVMQLFQSTDPAYPDGGQMRDFVYIKDCVDIMWWFLQTPTANGIYNIGTGTARTWVDLVTAVFNALGRSPHIEFIPMPLNLARKYQNFTEADIARLRAAGYTNIMTPIEEGVQDYIQSYLQQEDPYL